MNKKIIGLLSLFAVGGLILSPTFVLAQDIVIDEEPPPVFSDVEAMAILPNIINFVFGFLLAVVVLMILVAGYMFVTGGGNPETISKARNLLMYALIGLAIAVIARGLVALVGRIIGTTITV